MFKYVEIMYVFMAKELGFILMLIVLIVVFPLGAIAQQGIGSGFAESVGSNKVNESGNMTIGSGFAESIDGNESNTTKNDSMNVTEKAVNATPAKTEAEKPAGSGFAESIKTNEAKAKPWWQFW
jgi:hypothetical protein